MRKSFARYAGALVRGRRPRPYRLGEGDADALRIALELSAGRAAATGEDVPRPEFVAGLYRRLEAEEGAAAPGRPARRHTPARRRVLQGATVGAAGLVTGVAVTHVLDRHTAGRPAATATGSLDPDRGAWSPIVSDSGLAEGVLRRFDTGTVSGFVTRRSGRLVAVSGVCTHLGCQLMPEDGRLRCPCHQALFAADGKVLAHRLPIALPALPRIAVREREGRIEVYVPPARN
ncbi:MAG: Rieske (2Fe-2S) protein [Mycobacteriales bacterium]